MTPQRRLIRLLDHAGSRPLLALLSTGYARWKTGLDTEILYDQAWIRRTNRRFLAVSRTFDWEAGQIGEWKPDLADVLDQHRDWWFCQYQPRPGDVIVDIGAGVGEDALLFAIAVGTTGRVLTVEAQPKTFRLLQTTIMRNSLTNTKPFCCAIADKRGTLYIEDREAHQANTVSPTLQAGLAQQAVPALTIDEFCAEQGVEQIHFLKMNIEGAERLAIRGMERMISRIHHVCIACHDFLAEGGEFYRTKSLVMEFLQDHHFTICTRPEHPLPWVRDHICGARTIE